MSAIVIILTLLSIIVFSCNLFCVLNIAFSKHLRRASHIAICSLLFAHLIQGLVVIPSYAMKRAEFGNQRVVCDVFRFSYLFTNYAACTSLLLITLDRLIAVLYPLQYSVNATMKKMMYVLCSCWIYVVCLCVIPFFTAKAKSSCSYVPTKEWTLFMLTFNTLIPFIVIFISYILIFSRTKKAFKSRNTERARRHQSQRKVLKTTVLIVLSFIFCWGPSFVYYFLQAVCETCLTDLYRREDIEEIITFLMKVLTFVDGIIAPLIYCFMNARFNAERQKALRRLRASTMKTMRSRTLSLTVDYKDRNRSSPLHVLYHRKKTLKEENNQDCSDLSPKHENETGTIFMVDGKNSICLNLD